MEELPFPLRITADGTTAAQSSPPLHSIPSLIPFGTTHYGPTSSRLESLGVKARGSELRGGRSVVVGRDCPLSSARVRCQSVSYSSTVRVRCRTTRAPSEVMRSLIPMPMRRVASSLWARRNRTDAPVARSLIRRHAAGRKWWKLGIWRTSTRDDRSIDCRYLLVIHSLVGDSGRGGLMMQIGFWSLASLAPRQGSLLLRGFAG